MPRPQRRGICAREKIVPPVRVLIVDDSVVVRKVVCDALATYAEVEVAGTAATGAIALAKIPQLNPDVITLDIEMPGIDGIQTLVEIRKLYPKLPVIMFSTMTERGAAITLEALSLGASDYATKPTNSLSLTDTIEQVGHELVAKVVSCSATASTDRTGTIAGCHASESHQRPANRYRRDRHFHRRAECIG